MRIRWAHSRTRHLTRNANSEISKELSELRGDDGNLVFNAANICIHIYTRTFLEKVAAHHLGALPYHIAKKQIPSIDLEGNATKVDGWKFEKFVFDVFPESSSMLALKVRDVAHHRHLQCRRHCIGAHSVALWHIR